MAKNLEEKLEPGEYLRIKKIGNFFYGYARSQSAFRRTEVRYLGRCDEKGFPISPLHRTRKLKLNKIKISRARARGKNK